MTPFTELTEYAAFQAITFDGVGLQLKYRSLKRGPESVMWLDKGSEEWDCLIEGTHTLKFGTLNPRLRALLIPSTSELRRSSHLAWCMSNVSAPQLLATE